MEQAIFSYIDGLEAGQVYTIHCIFNYFDDIDKGEITDIKISIGHGLDDHAKVQPLEEE